MRKSRPGKLKLTKRENSPFWQVEGTVDGRRFRRSTGCTEKALADEYRIKWEVELQQIRLHGEEHVLTFAQAVTEYVRDHEDVRFIEPLLEYFGLTRILDITPRQVRAAGMNLYPGRASATINRQVITPVSAIINYALEGSGHGKRHFPRLKEPKGRMRWLTPEEAEILIHAAQGHGHVPHMILTLLGCGLRKGELLSALRDDAHIDSRRLYIPYEKAGEGRWASMPGRTAIALSTLRHENDRLFLNSYGRPYALRKRNQGGNFKAFDAAVKRSGLEGVTPHVLRHTFATWFAAQTKDLLRLKERGGWSKLATVERYAKVAPPDLPQRLRDHGWDFVEAENWGVLTQNATELPHINYNSSGVVNNVK